MSLRDVLVVLLSMAEHEAPFAFRMSKSAGPTKPTWRVQANLVDGHHRADSLCLRCRFNEASRNAGVRGLPCAGTASTPLRVQLAVHD